MSTRSRPLLRRLQPEGIPWPASVLYNALSQTQVFCRHYGLVAEHVAHYGPADSILDIGTGPGQLLLALHALFPDGRLVGIDVSPAMVAQARRNIEARGRSSRIEVLVARAERLPFVDGTFDRVVSTGSLHHWKDPDAALAEAHRVLRNGGYALIYDLVRSMPESAVKEAQARFGRFRLALLWLHSFVERSLTADEMRTLAEQSSFVVVGTRFVGALCCLILRKATSSANPDREEDSGQPDGAGDGW